MFTTVCPGCGASLNAPETVKGKKVKCKKCGEPFVARPKGADDDDDMADRKTVKMKASPPPVKSHREDDDDDLTDESPSLKGKKAKSRKDDEDTEVMESMRDRDDDDEEDEPKPKKKKGAGKGKSKKKEGSPAMLIILIAVGAIMLLGGGGAAAFFMFFNDHDQPTQPSAKGGATDNTKKGASAAGMEWVEHVDVDGKYRIKFPKAPTPINQQIPRPGGGVQNVKMNVFQNPPETFAAVHFALPAERAGLTDEQLLKLFVDQTLMQAKGIEKSRKSITYQGFSGTEVEIDETAKKSGGTIRAILAGNRVIVLAAGAENGIIDAARVKIFLDSLKIE